METAVAILLIITGAGIIGFWSMHIAKGGLPQGLRTVENGGYIGFHVSIELVTGGACLTSAVSILAGAGWATALTLASAGMLLYTSINSLAWSEVRNKSAFSLMFIVPALIALLTLIYSFTRI